MEDKSSQTSGTAQYERMLTGRIETLILVMAVPSIISQLVTSLYNIVDTYFVSRLGVSETGAVSIAYPVMTLIYAMGIFLGKGAGISLSRALGRADREEAERIMADGIIYMIFLGSVVAVLCGVFLEPLARILGATSTMMPYVRSYLGCILYALPFKAASVAMGCYFRFQGQFTKAMLGLGFGAVLNVILDPILIFALGLGVLGAAAATAIGQSCGFLLMIFMCGKGGLLPFRPALFRADPRRFRQYVNIGFPSLLKNSLSSVAAALLNVAASGFGDSVVAAMSIVNRSINICNTAFFGLTESLQTFVSFHYGAKRYDRMTKAIRFVWKFGISALAVIAIIMFIQAEELMELFTKESTVVSVGKTILRAQCCTLPLLPITSAGFVFLQAIGENKRAALVGTGRQALFLIPIVIIMPRIIGLTGVQLAQPMSDIMAMLLGIWVLRPVYTDLCNRCGPENNS